MDVLNPYRLDNFLVARTRSRVFSPFGLLKVVVRKNSLFTLLQQRRDLPCKLLTLLLEVLGLSYQLLAIVGVLSSVVIMHLSGSSDHIIVLALLCVGVEGRKNFCGVVLLQVFDVQRSRVAVF